MSYILDALRKSEAARRSREAPDLLQQAAPVAPPLSAPAARYGGKPAWTVAAIGVAALAVTLWLQLRDGSASVETAGDSPAASGVQALPIVEGPDTGGAPVPPPFAGNASADPLALSPAEIGPVPGMAPVSVPPPVLPAAPATSTQMPAQPTPGQAVSASLPTASVPATSLPTTTAPKAAPSEALDSLPERRDRPEARPAMPASAASTADTGSAGFSSPALSSAPVRLADLAPDLRRELPPLKLSMHLWNASPERRLLVLDGQRLRQGDVLGDVVVERIDRDGAVLAWRGGRILLPVQ